MAQVHIGHANLGESQRARAVTHPCQQRLCLIHLAFAASLTHTPILETRTQHWPDESSCEAFAAALASHFARHAALADATVELEGTLGAGKTTFVRHLLRALGVQGRIKSPTYAVVELYEIEQPSLPPLAVSHFDFYRFESPDEWEDAGFREVFAAPGLKLCEWAEKVAGRLPPPDLRIRLQIEADDSRSVTLHALTARGQELLR